MQQPHHQQRIPGTPAFLSSSGGICSIPPQQPPRSSFTHTPASLGRIATPHSPSIISDARFSTAPSLPSLRQASAAIPSLSPSIMSQTRLPSPISPGTPKTITTTINTHQQQQQQYQCGKSTALPLLQYTGIFKSEYGAQCLVTLEPFVWQCLATSFLQLCPTMKTEWATEASTALVQQMKDHLQLDPQSGVIFSSGNTFRPPVLNTRLVLQSLTRFFGTPHVTLLSHFNRELQFANPHINALLRTALDEYRQKVNRNATDANQRLHLRMDALEACQSALAATTVCLAAATILQRMSSLFPSLEPQAYFTDVFFVERKIIHSEGIRTAMFHWYIFGSDNPSSSSIPASPSMIPKSPATVASPLSQRPPRIPTSSGIPKTPMTDSSLMPKTPTIITAIPKTPFMIEHPSVVVPKTPLVTVVEEATKSSNVVTATPLAALSPVAIPPPSFTSSTTTTTTIDPTDTASVEQFDSGNMLVFQDADGNVADVTPLSATK